MLRQSQPCNTVTGEMKVIVQEAKGPPDLRVMYAENVFNGRKFIRWLRVLRASSDHLGAR